MTRYSTILSFTLLALAASCSKEPSGAEYFAPPPEGERRTYDVTVAGPLTRQVKGVAIVSNRGEETVGDQTYWETVTTFDGIPGSRPETSWVRVGDDGVYSRKSTDPTAPETLEWPLPPTVGRTWSSRQAEVDMKMTIAAMEDLDTAGKAYRNCLKVIGTGRKGTASLETTSYYAPDVGLVLTSTKGPGVVMEMRLRD